MVAVSSWPHSFLPVPGNSIRDQLRPTRFVNFVINPLLPSLFQLARLCSMCLYIPSCRRIISCHSNTRERRICPRIYPSNVIQDSLQPIGFESLLHLRYFRKLFSLALSVFSVDTSWSYLLTNLLTGIECSGHVCIVRVY